MITHLAPRRAHRPLVLLATLLVALAVPLSVLGHAELDTSVPAAGSTVDAPFAGPIVMTFTEGLQPASKADLVGGSETLPSSTTVDGKTMTLTPASALIEGDYEIRWTSVADDGHIERGTLAFTVAPAATAAPSASAATSAGPSASAAVSPSAAATVAPVPSAGGSGSSSSGSDVILPIVAAVIILGGLAVFLLRRRDSGSAAS
jgi:methionine-rich copper-binding protein CopC